MSLVSHISVSQAQDQITITGYEKNAEAARDAIMKIVGELEQMVSEDVTLDHRVHARIIGARGKAIRKIMDEFKVSSGAMPHRSGWDWAAIFSCVKSLVLNEDHICVVLVSCACSASSARTDMKEKPVLPCPPSIPPAYEQHPWPWGCPATYPGMPRVPGLPGHHRQTPAEASPHHLSYESCFSGSQARSFSYFAGTQKWNLGMLPWCSGLALQAALSSVPLWSPFAGFLANRVPVDLEREEEVWYVIHSDC